MSQSITIAASGGGVTTTTATSPVVQAATDMMSVLWAAELRGLPLPFAARAYDYRSGPELQFHTRDEVVTWAEAMDLDVDDDRMTATGQLLDITVTVCAYVADEVAR